jgi:hypothetical protein
MRRLESEAPNLVASGSLPAPTPPSMLSALALGVVPVIPISDRIHLKGTCTP